MTHTSELLSYSELEGLLHEQVRRNDKLQRENELLTNTTRNLIQTLIANGVPCQPLLRTQA